MDNRTLTTGEVAKICNVATRTVAKWIDSGELKGFRLPGGKNRRVLPECLIAFMKRNDIPLELTKEEVLNEIVV